MRRLAIICGSGLLPAIAAREAIAQGWSIQLYVVSEEEFAQQDGIEDLLQYCKTVTLTQFGNILRTLKKDSITDLIMLGKIKKEVLFKNPRFDLKTLWLLSKLINRNDNTIFYGIKKELEKIKINILPQSEFLKKLLMKKKVYSKKKPSKKDWKDIEFGLYYAKKIGALDIGQTVIVKNRTVLAVEAIEGTDLCIQRGGKLSHGKGAVVCKSAKAKQDARFDMPTVGMQTLQSMKESGCNILAIEADEIFAITPKEIIDFADKNKMILVATEVVEIEI